MSQEVQVTIFTDGGLSLKITGKDLTIFGGTDQKLPFPNLASVKAVIVKTDVVLLDTEDASFVVT